MVINRVRYMENVHILISHHEEPIALFIVAEPPPTHHLNIVWLLKFHLPPIQHMRVIFANFECNLP